MTGPTLSDDVVLLSPPGEDDVDAITTACQDPDIQHWTTVPSPYTRADAEGFVPIVAEGWRGWTEHGSASTGGLNWAIRAGGELVGMVGLLPEGTGSAEVGYWLASGARGRGLVHRALLLVLAWGFDASDGPSLERVFWRAYTGNVPSWRAAWGVGFRFEGTPRLAGVQRGRRRDAWIGTLLRDDPRFPASPWPGTPFPLS